MAGRPTRNQGLMLLGVWLILAGLTPILNITTPGLVNLLAGLAIAAGVLILIGR